MRTADDVRHLTVTIRRPPGEVYRFVADPANLPRWAAGLSGSIAQVGGEWIAASPLGPVKVRFAAPNDLGVLDHEVVLASGEVFRNPLRVVPNGDGSEVTFTLFRWPGTTDAAHAADAGAVERDLQALKALLERGG